MQEQERELQRGIDRALARSVLYETLALGFRPPEPEGLRRLTHPAEARALATAASMLDPRQEAGLEGAIHGLRRASPERSQDGCHPDLLRDLALRHERLFGHTTRGALSAYETEYGEDTAFQQPQQLGDLSGFLGAFGLGLADGARERVDHVSVECEFMAFLARKEAYALQQHDAEMTAATRKAERLFLRDHLGRFAPALGRMLAREDAGGFHAALGELCRRFISAECSRHGVPAGPEFMPLRTPAEDRTPMACGTASELIQIRDSSGAGAEESPSPEREGDRAEPW